MKSIHWWNVRAGSNIRVIRSTWWRVRGRMVKSGEFATDGEVIKIRLSDNMATIQTVNGQVNVKLADAVAVLSL